VDETGHCKSARCPETTKGRTVGSEHDINVLIGDVSGSAGVDHGVITAYRQSAPFLGPYQRY
jgi:hypothetical protein